VRGAGARPRARAGRRALAALLLGALVPLRAVALAGFAEHSRTLHFNRFAELRWQSPGDACEGEDPFCLELVRPGGYEHAGVDESLEAINVPEDPASPYVLAQRSSDGSWLVYDLGAQRFVAERAGRTEALAAWRRLGLAEPELIDARSPERHLRETGASALQRWRERTLLTLVFELPALLLAVLLFGGIALGLGRDYRRSGSRPRLALCVVFALPAVLAGARILYSLGGAALSRMLLGS